jgi:hypothetical protein
MEKGYERDEGRGRVWWPCVPVDKARSGGIGEVDVGTDGFFVFNDGGGLDWEEGKTNHTGEAITSFLPVACTFQEKQPAAVSAIAHGIFPSAPVSFRSRWIEGLPGNYCGVGPVADRSSRVVSRNGREKGIAGARTSTAAVTPSVGGQGRGGGAATAANLGRLAREA